MAGVATRTSQATDSALAVVGPRQRLADDALQRAGELHPHLLLLVRREHVDDAVDRLRRVLRVQGGEHEVTGLGGGQRHGDRLQVAHLTDQDDVRVLPQDVLQRLLERVRVLPHLALVDQRRLVGVEELDRVLAGHDVVPALPVGEVDDAGERGRLPGAGRAGDEDEPAREHREVRDARRHAEVLELLDLVRDQTEGGAEGVPLAVEVDAEAGLARAPRRRSRAPARPRTSPAASA